MSKNTLKKWKTKILWAEQTIVLRTLPFSPWAVSATWLHVVPPYKIQDK
jgi:hypothetical protein